MLPKYIYFKPHHPAAHTGPNTKRSQINLIARQITSAQDDINNLNTELRKLKQLFANNITETQYDEIQQKLSQSLTDAEIQLNLKIKTQN